MILIGHKYLKSKETLERLFEKEYLVKSTNTFSGIIKEIRNNSKKIKAILLSTTLVEKDLKKKLKNIDLLLERKVPIFLIVNQHLEECVYDIDKTNVIDIIEEPFSYFILKIKVENISKLYSENEEMRLRIKNKFEESNVV